MHGEKLWNPNLKYTIYRIRNTENGRCYVGSTNDVEYRFGSHHWHLENGEHHNPDMMADWKSHGATNFAFEILDTDVVPTENPIRTGVGRHIG
jgi:group I intron endonuclease